MVVINMIIRFFIIIILFFTISCSAKYQKFSFFSIPAQGYSYRNIKPDLYYLSTNYLGNEAYNIDFLLLKASQLAIQNDKPYFMVFPHQRTINNNVRFTYSTFVNLVDKKRNLSLEFDSFATCQSLKQKYLKDLNEEVDCKKPAKESVLETNQEKIDNFRSTFRDILASKHVPDEFKTYYLQSGNIKEIRKRSWKNDQSKTLVIKYFENGNFKTKERSINSKLEGQTLIYYENGNLKAKQNYKNNKLHGLHIKYYKNGALSSKVNFKNGQKHGQAKFYHLDGQLKHKENWKLGKQHGISSQYNKLGKLIAKGVLKEGKKHGTLINYYDNGNIKFKIEFRDGKKNGMKYHYYDNGKIKSKTNYIDDKKEGTSIHYYLNGKIEQDNKFVDDKANGLSKQYYSNGNIKSEAEFKDNKQDGITIFYDVDGNIRSKQKYRRGKFIKKIILTN